MTDGRTTRGNVEGNNGCPLGSLESSRATQGVSQKREKKFRSGEIKGKGFPKILKFEPAG